MRATIARYIACLYLPVFRKSTAGRKAWGMRWTASCRFLAMDHCCGGPASGPPCHNTANWKATAGHFACIRSTIGVQGRVRDWCWLWIAVPVPVAKESCCGRNRPNMTVCLPKSGNGNSLPQLTVRRLLMWPCPEAGERRRLPMSWTGTTTSIVASCLRNSRLKSSLVPAGSAA